MKSFGAAFFATALSAALVVPAFANESSTTVLPNQQFSAADASLIFEADAKPMQLAALSSTEMKETQGAWAIHAARMGYGGLSSGIRYGVSNWGTPQYSAWGNARAVGYGAVGGLFGWNSWSSATLGASAGAAGQRWGW